MDPLLPCPPRPPDIDLSTPSLAEPRHLDHLDLPSHQIRTVFLQRILNRGRGLTCLLSFIVLCLEFVIEFRERAPRRFPIYLTFAVIAVVSSTRCPSITGLGTGTACLRL